MPIKPERLRPRDWVGIVAPASPPKDPGEIELAVRTVERLGFRVKLGANLRRRNGFLAGTDSQRAGDLMKMFADPKVKAILCLRGGYGTARLAPYLDYKIIRANPKIFLGYSDITFLHAAFLKHAKLLSFHGPMLSSELIKEDLPAFTLEGMLRTLTLPSAPGNICQGYTGRTVRTVNGGVACGQLVGGNLTILCTILGTPVQPSFRNKILFLEEIDEAPYRIDRLLTHLFNAQALQQVSGVAIGLVQNCRDSNANPSGEFRQTVEEVLGERLKPLGVPVVLGLPFGHGPFNATLPVGAKAQLDAKQGDLTIVEPVVH